jgi:D-glycerate 3-kinase
MECRIIAEATAWLQQSSTLTASARTKLAVVVPALVEALPQENATLIGVGGPPGTGKSTLARLLCAMLTRSGRPAGMLSLDDYYLPKAARCELATELHPLFASRGVPGTHDLDLLLHDVQALLAGRLPDLKLPRFDKARDDRAAAANRWHGPAPEVLFVEGWCIGFRPNAGLAQAEPVNDWEREADPDGQWWATVCKNAAEYERRLHSLLDQRWLMVPPDWSAVVAWRWEQEQALGTLKRLQSREEVRSFLATFERLGRHMLASAERWADLIIKLDQEHRPGVRRLR